ncbi:MAG: 4-hydroxythreonine-4-phosphate dehydrogenase PdxA [Lautropia sp.]
MTNPAVATRPTVALFMGDPAGIGPELTVRLLADGQAARQADILVIGSRSALAQAARETGLPFDVTEGDTADARGRVLERPLLLRWPGLEADGFERARVTERNGRFMLDGLALGLDLCRDGTADVLCFAPLNKAALRAGGMNHPDELHWFCERLDFHGDCVEFNVLEGLWTSRVTSHMPLKDVSAALTPAAIAAGIRLLYNGLREAGIASPKIAVCGFNPHNGDGGAFGREEIDVIEPGIAAARAAGFPAEGPYPADTIFVRATRNKDRGGGYDGVLTMFHDQGQIAMKLMGFERGVTVPGGLPMPITTAAHGTAYDIAGRGIANAGAMQNAFALACRFGATRRAAGYAGRPASPS